MVLGIAPLIVFAASVVVAAVLLRRQLPRAGEALAVACVRCGTPGAALAHDSFVCPGCGRDVREAGLAPARGRSRTWPLWTVMLFTVAVLVAAQVTAGVAEQAAPRVEAVASETTLAAPRSGAYAGVVVAATASGPPDARRGWRSQTLAELTALDGRSTLLEVEGPSGRWRVTGDDGRLIDRGQPLDDEAVLRWYRAAGVDVSDYAVRAEAAEVKNKLAEWAGGARVPWQSVRVRLDALFSSRGERNSSSSRRATWVAALVVAGWSVVWVLGVWALLRLGRAGAGNSPPPAPTAQPAAGSVTP